MARLTCSFRVTRHRCPIGQLLPLAPARCSSVEPRLVAHRPDYMMGYAKTFERLAEESVIGNATFVSVRHVADRGMISAATIAALEARKIDYILPGARRSSTEVRETVLHDDGTAVPLSIPRPEGSKPIWR